MRRRCHRTTALQQPSTLLRVNMARQLHRPASAGLAQAMVSEPDTASDSTGADLDADAWKRMTNILPVPPRKAAVGHPRSLMDRRDQVTQPAMTDRPR
jgi:hypothetical protein